MTESHFSNTEYKALRSELLLLINKAFDIWKWSLVSVFLLAGAVIFAVFIKPGALLQIVKEHPWVLSMVLMVFLSGTIWTLSEMLIDIEETQHRLGAYLAIFHDQDIEQLRPKLSVLRYHIWTRIDQYVPISTKSDLVPPKRGFYGFSHRLNTYLELQFFFGLLVPILLSVHTTTLQWGSLMIGMVFVFIIGLRLRSLEKKGLNSFPYWNKRWLKIMRLSYDDLQQALTNASLNFSWDLSEKKAGQQEDLDDV